MNESFVICPKSPPHREFEKHAKGLARVSALCPLS